MKKIKAKLVFIILTLCFYNCNSNKENNYIYNSKFSSTQILSREEPLDTILVDSMFDKLEDIEIRTQREFIKKDTNKRIIHFHYSINENVNIHFISKNNDLIYNVKNKEIKLNKIQTEYLEDFLKNLKQLELHRDDLIFSFDLCLPENLYIENGKRQPPPPPPF